MSTLNTSVTDFKPENTTEQTQEAITNNSKPEINNKTEDTDLNKENIFVNYFFYSLTAFILIGTGYMMTGFDTYWEERIHHKPDFERPQINDLLISIYSIPGFVICRKFFDSVFSQFMFNHVLEEKYKNPKDEKNWELGIGFKKKLTVALFKVVYFIIFVLFAFSILKDMTIFPYELGGKSSMFKIYDGVSNNLFFDRHYLFKYYYLIALGYTLTDLVYLLFIYDSSSDFPVMLTHHSATISLILFSYLTGISHIGVVVLFLHDFTDIFVYFTRIVVNANIKRSIKYFEAAVFLLVYFYMRIYTFGKVIIMGYMYFDDFNIQLTYLMRFLCVLMLMHIYWVYQIIIRFCYKSLTDIGKVKNKKK